VFISRCCGFAKAVAVQAWIQPQAPVPVLAVIQKTSLEWKG
jgi:hypothetical protein